MHSWRNSNPTRWFRLQNKTENKNLSCSLSATTIPEQSHLGRVRVFTKIMSYKRLLMTWAASTLIPRNLKTDVSLWKHQMFSLYTTPEELKNATSTFILDLCLEKTRAGKSRDTGEVIVSKEFRFPNFFCPHENKKLANSSGWSQGVFKKLRFRDGLVWTVDLTVEIKLFSNFSGVM